MIKHKCGALNRVVDALSCRRSLFSDSHISVLGFDSLPEAYASDSFFSKVLPFVHDGSNRVLSP